MMRAKSKAPLILATLACLSVFPYLPKALAGSATISENKSIVTGPPSTQDFITGGQFDLIVTDGFYSTTAFPKPRFPIYSFNETDVQLGYMFPVIGQSFYRGNFEGLANLFLWESVREHSGILGGGALGIHYNFVQPGWRFVPYIGGSLGLSGNDLYVQQSQRIIGGPFEFVLQANVGARYFVDKNWGFIIEGGYEHVSNNDIYPRNVGINQTGGRFGIFCTF
jgi:Lipid A 3-O-deacylase (PagL)